MTKEQFREFTEEVIPQQLFHVEPSDLDDDTGVQLDELILVRLIANQPECLKYKPLQWFLNTFLIKTDEKQPTLKEEAEFGNHLQGQIDKQMKEEQELFRQILEDERETENTFDIARHIEDSQEPNIRLIKGALGNKS